MSIPNNLYDLGHVHCPVQHSLDADAISKMGVLGDSVTTTEKIHWNANGILRSSLLVTQRKARRLEAAAWICAGQRKTQQKNVCDGLASIPGVLKEKDFTVEALG